MGRFSSLFTDSPVDHTDAHPPEKPASRRYRLLIVDDEANVRSALRRVFQQENYEISLAANGQEALRLMEQQTFQVLITDFKMPVMDGGEFLRHARKLQPDTIRIMLTGHADVSAVMAAVKEGAVYRFILKPWNDDDLRVTVALAIEQYDLLQKNKTLQSDKQKADKHVAMLSKLATGSRSQLVIALNKRGLLTEQQAQQVFRLQQTRKEPVIRLLLEQNWISEDRLRDMFRKDFLFEDVSLAEFQIMPAALDLLPKHMCRRHLVLPLKASGRRMLVALADPLDMGLIEELRFIAGMEIDVVFAPVSDIEAKIEEVFGGDSSAAFQDMEALVAAADPYESVELVIEDDDKTSIEELLRSTEEPPAIRLVNAIIIEAVRLGVSDIHIQPRAKAVAVRYRIDGLLTDKIHIPHHLYPSLVSRLKVMAELDIAERRRPQDGRITVKTPMRIVDLRISTLPTITGEKVVMRVLDRNGSIRNLGELGFSDADRQLIELLVAKPQGIVLATGPTGSGKTTTLYSLLQSEATPTKNYVTIEEPVEFYMDMAGQVSVREKIGLVFPVILRSILRQDPDVILLGEIRDFETAEVAFHAAMTGHLVFSTLHTNSAVATIARLLDLGLKPFVVASALEGVIAQRLVRKICDHCREPTEPTTQVLRMLGPPFLTPGTTFYAGRGCKRCSHTGYKGRAGLYEVLVPNDDMREQIGRGASVMELKRLAQSQSVATLLEDGFLKSTQGVTTPEEVLRVLGPQVAL